MGTQNRPPSYYITEWVKAVNDYQQMDKQIHYVEEIQNKIYKTGWEWFSSGNFAKPFMCARTGTCSKVENKLFLNTEIQTYHGKPYPVIWKKKYQCVNIAVPIGCKVKKEIKSW